MKSALSLDDVLEAIPSETADLVVRVVSRARELEVPIWLVGGPVRDLLLGRPLVDVDLTVGGDARQVAEAVRDADASEQTRLDPHDRFGTVRIERDGAELDLAGLRHESYAHPGALPVVVPGDLEQDMQRRDFSINALACALDPEAPARRIPITDLVGGLDDLARGRLRILHDQSFHDDPTRAWRAARFSARLGVKLERRSRIALSNALRDGAFGAVSGERFRRELELSFAEAEQGVFPGQILRWLSDWHVLPALEPGLVLPKDRVVPLRRLAKAIAAPEWPAPRWRPWLAGLSIWLAPLPAALRRRTLERFSIRGEQAKRILRFGREGDRLLRTLAKARGRGAVDAVLAELPEETVQAVHALADVAVRRRILRWGAEDRRRRVPVGGAELKEVGLEGADVGRALARIREGFLDGEIANREEALALAVEMARRGARRGPKKPAKKRAKKRKVARGSSIADTPADRSRSKPARDPVPADSPQAPRTDTSR